MSGEPTDPGRAPLTRLPELVALCLERLTERGPQAVEELLQEHPQQAAAVRERLARLSRIGLLPAAEGRAPPPPERIGHFRLLRRIGSGGMGVVYLAEQEPLGRQVALKLVRPDMLHFEGSRDRFRREVTAIAHLKHPGIVPVYTGGEVDGMPYYAMEYIEGCTLAEVIDFLRGRSPADLNSGDLTAALEVYAPAAGEAIPDLGENWTEVCLRLIVPLADTLDHAHRHGVLHRDVKPSNLMLARDGRVLLLDFGLASTQDAARITRTGTPVGSLHYMSPEQALGETETLQATTDVYSLGVVLYELLTLQAPFDSPRRAETLRQIQEGRPEPLRSHNPAVPWDAETACLVAMERDPSRRYPSAAAFARDLRNILDLRPIEARRPGLALRLRRFSQRHPAWSVGVVMGVLLFAGSLIYAVQLRAANRFLSIADREKAQAIHDLQQAYRRLEESRVKAESAAQRAQRNFRRALDAAHHMLTRVGFDEMEDVPAVAKLRQALLERADRLYTDLQSDQPEETLLLFEMARLYRLMGQFHSEHGDPTRAEERLRGAIAILEQLQDQDDAPPQIWEQHVNALMALGNALSWFGRLQEAVEPQSDAIAVAEQGLDRLHNAGLYAETQQLRSILASAFANLGGLLGTLGRTEDAVAALQEARWQFEELGEASFDSDDRNLATVNLLNLGGILIEEQPEEAAELLWTALEDAEGGLQKEPTARSFQHFRARALHLLGELRILAAEYAQAEQHLSDSLGQYRQLTRTFPSYHEARHSTIDVLQSLAALYHLQHHTERRDEALSEALRISQELRSVNPVPRSDEQSQQLEELILEYSSASQGG
jgi:hypothetical protein